MQNPIRLDLYADRGLAFVETLQFVGQDFSAAVFRSQVRLTPDATVEITDIGVSVPYSGTTTVAAHIAAGHLSPEIYGHVNPTTGNKYQPTDSTVLSLVRLAISTSGMADIPAANETGDDVVLAWDLLIDPDGGGSLHEDKWAYGTFTVRGTVTQ